ncbi:MAG: DUF268 domain-containing protein [Leptospirillia bacterium]
MTHPAANAATRLKEMVKARPWAKRLALWLLRMAGPMLETRPFRAPFRYAGFVKDWFRFRAAGGKARARDFHPCLFDRTTRTGVDSHYFYQAVWAFKKIQDAGPSFHVDVGSDVRFVGMLTTVCPLAFIDIRPAAVTLNGFSGVSGSILQLPFADDSVNSLSSMHVIEHIGLGRYGDPIDPQGSRKAGVELVRVLAPGGRLYVSLPMGTTRVQFNGQRIFQAEDALDLFPDLKLVEMAMVDELGQVQMDVQPHQARIGDGGGLDFGLGMYVLEKPLRSAVNT